MEKKIIITINQDNIMVKSSEKDYVICQEGKGFGVYVIYHEKQEGELTNRYYITNFKTIFEALDYVYSCYWG